MSTTTIGFNFKVNGVPTDATAVVLRDPTGAFGVRRKDTLAVVVPAGTALARTAAGTYSYALADPAPGLSYNYWVEATWSGATWRFEKESSQPAAASPASYLSVGDADLLAATMPGLGSWPTAAADAKAKALERASGDVDAAMPYQGRKFDPAQILQFPRVAFDAGDAAGAARGPAAGAGAREVVWDWDPLANEAVAPRDVLRAVVYQADAILTGVREPRLAAQHDGVVYELTGTLAESYKRTTGPGVTSGLCRPAWMLVRKYRVKAGKIL